MLRCFVSSSATKWRPEGWKAASHGDFSFGPAVAMIVVEGSFFLVEGFL